VIPPARELLQHRFLSANNPLRLLSMRAHLTRVRCCAPRFALILASLSIGRSPHAAAQLPAAELFAGPSVDFSHGPLRISEQGRRVVHADGTPFFWLGDTAWELFHRLNRDEAEHYLEDRRSKGFNVIQAVVLAELDGLSVPNPYGHTPLIDNDPSRPDESYFRHVDFIVDRAAVKGMYIGMLPTWGDKFNRKWGVGPEIFTVENARIYGAFLGRRYRDRPIIWILGGDRSPESETHLAIIRAMAEGIREGDGGAHLMTYHPMGGNASSTWFHHDRWLDLNMFQSGHGERDRANYEMTSRDYLRVPVKPVLDGEPRYEDHPVNWRPEEGWFDEFDVRQAAYWSLLSGAAGHTYGDHNIWQMWEPGRNPISSARTPWREALHHPGSRQMGYARRLFESRPFLLLEPDTAALVDAGEGSGHQVAARARDGSYLFAYTPLGRPLTLRMNRITGLTARAHWFDPRTGNAEDAGSFPTSEVRSFSPPGEEGRGNDWILVLDREASDLGRPGIPAR
jgi:hypothetical protein